MQVDAKPSSDPSLRKQTDLPSPLGNHVVDELDLMSANELEDVAGRLGLDERAEYVVSAEQRGAMHLDSDHDDDFEEVAVGAASSSVSLGPCFWCIKAVTGFEI